MLKGSGQSNWENYLDHIGLWFIFTACAGISLIVWAFNWVCWLNQCCCCDFLHNPINKRIAWWMSFSFLLGILACCISAFVSVNRFGFALEGAWCAVDRIYYDSKYGQLKTSDPKWEGFSNLNTISEIIYNFYDSFEKVNAQDDKYWENQILKKYNNKEWKFNNDNNDLRLYSVDGIITSDEKSDEKTILCLKRFTKLVESLKQISSYFSDTDLSGQKDIIKNFIKQSDFEQIKNDFLDNFDYYAKALRACMKVLAMIYYCLLLIVITAAGVSMMFYACLKRQGYLLTFMKVLWNIIRFFMFSFFLYGTAYGIGFLAIRDSVAYIMYIFNENLNLDDSDIKLVGKGKDFLKFCLADDNNNLKAKFNQIYSTSIDDFFTNYKEINDNVCNYGNVKENLQLFNVSITSTTTGYTSITVPQLNNLLERAGREGGLFGSFDCGFLKSDLNILYTALYDASVESRALAALSLSASFFGAVAVYFYLLVMHHYNNDLFFDSGKSIFKGFDGFGGGYHKKNKNQDPAYKKRKLRAELDLTSKNEELSNYKEYKDVNKNDEED